MALVKMSSGLIDYITASVAAPFKQQIQTTTSQLSNSDRASRAGAALVPRILPAEHMETWRSLPASWRYSTTKVAKYIRVDDHFYEFLLMFPEPMPEPAVSSGFLSQLAGPYGTNRAERDQRALLKEVFPEIHAEYGDTLDELSRLKTEMDRLVNAVRSSCNSAPSLNRMLKDAPGLERYIPGKYLTKVKEAPLPKPRKDWKADDLQQSLLRGNILTSSKSGG